MNGIKISAFYIRPDPKFILCFPLLCLMNTSLIETKYSTIRTSWLTWLSMPLTIKSPWREVFSRLKAETEAEYSIHSNSSNASPTGLFSVFGKSNDLQRIWWAEFYSEFATYCEKFFGVGECDIFFTVKHNIF